MLTRTRQFTVALTFLTLLTVLSVSHSVAFAEAIPNHAAGTAARAASGYTVAVPSSPSPDLIIGGGGGCFPSGVVWTWTDTARSVPLQAWMSNLEYDSSSGWHYNLHVQALCGGDYFNYHITYLGIASYFYTWRAGDSVTGVNRYYPVQADMDVDTAAGIASSAMATAVGEDAGDAGLTNALLTYNNGATQMLTDAFIELASPVL